MIDEAPTGPNWSTSLRLRLLIWLVLLVGGGAAGIWLDLKFFPRLFTNAWWHLTTLTTGLILLRLVFQVSRVTGRTLARLGLLLLRKSGEAEGGKGFASSKPG